MAYLKVSNKILKKVRAWEGRKMPRFWGGSTIELWLDSIHPVSS